MTHPVEPGGRSARGCELTERNGRTELLRNLERLLGGLGGNAFRCGYTVLRPPVRDVSEDA